jgi:cytochrome d ubiquinol oxidase subunit II
MELQTIWFFLWGLLWAVFFMTDGFDFGVGTLYPFIGKTDTERKTMLSAIGPLWDGNEVWMITAGGVTFAAFPAVYATMFSALYTPLMLILFSLIIRGVSIEFRSQIESPGWKKIWDTCFFVGSAAPALLFGVAFANIFMGLPIDGEGVFHGNLLTLLNPYGLMGGVLFLVLFIQHGALWLCIRTEGDLHDRAARVVEKIWPVVLVMTLVFVVASYFFTGLFKNYFAQPALFIVILAAVAALVGVRYFIMKKSYFMAWGASSLTIVLATFFGVIGLFPTLFGSNMDPAFSLTAFNSSSSPLTLKIMLGVVIVFIPLVIVYQAWAYKVFSTKVKEEDLHHGEAY